MPIDKVKKNAALIETVEQFLQAGFLANEEFNYELNGDETITIRSLKDIDTEYKYNSSEILYWVDRETYLDELDSWNGEKIRASHTDAIDFIKSSNQEAIFADLIELIRRQRIAPFLGAGVSKAAGYPLWQDALTRFANKIATIDTEKFNQLLSENKYLSAAQLLFNASEHQLNNLIQTEFRTGFDTEDARERIPKLFKLLPRLSKSCIVTTNFDRLIEEAFKLKGTPLIDGYMHGVQAGNGFVQSLLKGDRCILKLHGDVLQTHSYVFTERQYEDAYGSPINYGNQLPRALRQIYITNSLLFLGCSLSEDRTLELFKEIKDGKQFEIPDHFAIICDPENSTQKQSTEDRLLSIKIRPIWYKIDDSHSMVTKLVELAVDIAERRLTLS